MSTSKIKNATVKELMVTDERMPAVFVEDIVKKTLEVMSQVKLGFCCIINSEKKLLGVFTDGDLRRLLLRHQKPFSSILIDDIANYMSPNPVTVSPNATIDEAVVKMYETQIWDLPVVTVDGQLVGVLHMHDALRPKL